MKILPAIMRFLLFALTCASFVLGQSAPACAQSASEISDFGAETIEPDSSDSSVPLPVELVEEPSVIPPGRAETDIPNSSGKTQGSGTGDQGGVAGAEASAEPYFLKAKDLEIAELVKLISKRTKRNYILDSSVKGKIDILQETPVTTDEALRIFDTVLLLKGFTAVPVGENMWKIIPAKDAKQTTIPLVLDKEGIPTDTLVTRLMRLKYSGAANIQQLLSQFVSKDGVLNAFEDTNTLVMIDSAANIERLSDLVKQLDVPALDQDITVIPILHAEAVDVADKIQQILGEDEDGKGSQPRIPTRVPITPRPITRPGMPGQAPGLASSQSVGTRTLPFKLIPDERTNSLIVVADSEMTLKVRALAEQLDSEIDRSGGKFYVYRLKHADAEELADILQQVITGAAPAERSSSSKLTGSSLSSRSRSSSSSSTSTSTSSQRARFQGASPYYGSSASTFGGPNLPGAAIGKVSLESEVIIAPDPSTNSLIINASRADYGRIKEVIEELDTKRRQVLVEATILEVSLNSDEGMGIELQGTAGNDDGGIFAQTNWGGLTNLLSNPAALSDLTIAAASTGTLTLPGGIVIPSQAALVTAVSSNSNVNVLSSPTITATDNQEAEIAVGENVPFVTSTSSDPSNLNNTFNQIERQNVGITLRITPQISTGNFVVLQIFVEISNVVAGTRNDPNGPTTTIRTTETTVEVKNGQMVVTGGLISDSVTDSSRGIPFLQDIPVIGQYLRRDDQNRRRTNLLVFITPRIIGDQYEARETTREFSHQLSTAIQENQSIPDRAEILGSDRIDRVAEEMPSGDILPTPISPPEGITEKEARSAVERTQRRFQSMIEGPSEMEGTRSTSGNKVERGQQISAGHGPRAKAPIEVRVSPKLPGMPSSTDNPVAENASSGVKLDSQSRAISGSASTFVVLRDLTSDRNSDANPTEIAYADTKGTLGLVLVGTLSSPATQFFVAGGRYTLNTSKGARNFVCLGRYGSTEEAGLIHAGLRAENKWNYLSPQQTLALNKLGWSRH